MASTPGLLDPLCRDGPLLAAAPRLARLFGEHAPSLRAALDAGARVIAGGAAALAASPFGAALRQGEDRAGLARSLLRDASRFAAVPHAVRIATAAGWAPAAEGGRARQRRAPRRGRRPRLSAQSIVASVGRPISTRPASSSVEADTIACCVPTWASRKRRCSGLDR